MMLMLMEIGASDQQRAALQEFEPDSMETSLRFSREMGEKMLKILTPPQQEKLWQEIDRRRSQPSGPSADTKPGRT
jgi:hypothetical protein